jgi:hypothetical protein
MNSENEDNISEYKVVYKTRLILSLLQWLNILIIVTLGIIGAVDSLSVGNNPKEWVGDDDDETINGVQQKTGSISWIVYASLTTSSVILCFFSTFIEWYIYGYKYVGYDLGSCIVNKKQTKDISIERSMQCYTFNGVNYKNLYNGLFLTPIALFSLTIFHVIFERDASRIAAIYPISAGIILLIVLIGLYKKYTYEIKKE